MCKDHIYQHIVPRCYLKYFSPNKKQICVKKRNGSTSFDNINEVGGDNYFYDINTPNTGRKTEIEENVLGKTIETPYGDYLKHIYEEGKKYLQTGSKNIIFEGYKKHLFAAFIVVQYIRLPRFKHYFELMAQDFEKCPLKFLAKEQLEKVADSEDINTYPYVSAPLLHANFGFNNYAIIDKYAKFLSDNYWEFLITSSNKVCTSNNPIQIAIINSTIDAIPYSINDIPKFTALLNKFEEWVPLPYDDLINFDMFIGFPINRNVYLKIWNKNKFPHKKETDCLFAPISDVELKSLNLMTYHNCTELYSHLSFNEIFDNEIKEYE